MNNATASTPAGAFAYVAATAKVDATLGFWTKIGDGAVVPASVELGNWSDVGHFSKIGRHVKFGPWACVGMDAVVESGSVLGSHEYVPSGCRRTRAGKVERLSMPEAFRAIHVAFDRYQTAIPAGAYSHEDYAILKRGEEEALQRVRDLLPAYLAAHDAARPVGLISSLVALFERKQ